jgi:hypothetical protein
MLAFMADSPAIIQYLRSCYEADNRQAAVSDLFHKSIRHLHFLDGEDRLLCGFLPRIPLSPETARPALTDAQLYRREKSLLYCAFPIVGSLPARGVRPVVRLCAPLLLYPAKLVEHESVINLEIDLEQQQVNLPVLADLVADEPTSDFDLDELVREFPQAPFDEDGVQSLISLLQDFIPHFDALPLTRFPQLESEEDVRKLLRRVGKQEDKLTCASACALALTPNSPNTRGVLFELEQIARDTNLSTPLRMVLGERVGDLGKRGKPKDIRVPAVLSQAQHEVLGSAASAPLTLVVGPPGTGKSYTIAALAVDHVSRGESVLIACRKHQAVDVVAKMIDGMLGPNQCVIRGGQSQHVRELKKFLGGMLQGIRSQIQRSKRQTIKHAGNPDRQLAALDRDLARREADFISQLRDEMLWGELASEDDTGFFAGFILRWRVQWLEKRLGRQPAIWDGLREYDDALATSNQLTRELLKERIDNRVERTLKEHRRDLTRFLDSLRTRSSTRQEKLFAEINPRLLFNTFPIWLTSVADAAELVPLEAETFDVAVFDEATQCDMASCLPILQRAKRAVVVGDPNQLRHISFLSNERLQHLADQHGLDQDERQSLHYRDKSFLDLVNENIESQDRVHFLNEHFRSMPQIIRFSNDRIYQNALSIMRLRPKTATAQCVFSRFVEDGRKTAGANAIEAESLVRGLIQLVESQKTLPAEVCQTIGVLSPFRDQVDLIARELEGRLPLAAFTRHDLRVGTAHAFQGDERDVMLLSLVVDKDAHHSSLRFLNQPNLFNVTITRARHQQYVFHSVAAGELPADSLLRQYLESIDSTAPPAQHQVAVADEFLNQVGDALSGDGFHVWPEYELAGVMIDLVVEKESRTLGIDLVGYPGDFGAALDLERYRILRRAGLPVLPLPHRLWRRDPQLCLRAIESRLIG